LDIAAKACVDAQLVKNRARRGAQASGLAIDDPRGEKDARQSASTESPPPRA